MQSTVHSQHKVQQHRGEGELMSNFRRRILPGVLYLLPLPPTGTDCASSVAAAAAAAAQ